MADCYANENFPLPVVEALRRLGHNLLTTYESGQAGQAIPDEEVLAFASSESRIVLTRVRSHLSGQASNRAKCEVAIRFNRFQRPAL